MEKEEEEKKKKEDEILHMCESKVIDTFGAVAQKAVIPKKEDSTFNKC